jgi:signal transduction histidine kinase/ActR/RegA family two-component response regulator
VRSLLAGLIAGTLLPFVVFGVATVARTAREERAAIERRLSESSRSLADAIDREMTASVRALEALGGSEALDRGDLAAFREEAIRVRVTQPRWQAVALFTSDGARIMDTRPAAAQPSRTTLEPPSLRESVSTGRSTVGSLTMRPDGSWAFGVRVPVRRGGQILWVLTAVTHADALEEIVGALDGDEGIWTRTIVDRAGTVVARSRAPERFVGRPATAPFLARTRASREGVYQDVTLEGAQAYVAFSHAALSGWTTAVVVPVAMLDDPQRQSLLATAGFALALVVLGAGGALVASRRFARALGSAEAGAAALARGEPPGVDACGIAEVARLGEALGRSAELLAARARERDDHLARAEGARAEAVAANRTKDEFLAMLGHELRNPLAPIATALHLLEQRGAGDTREHAIIRRQIAHLQRLVDDLLDVSRITRGKVELRRERVEVAAFVGKAIEMARDLLEQRRHRLTVDVLPGLFVDGDPVRLAQVVANLLTNAARYTPPGGNVHVGALQEGDVVRIWVQDDGAGLARHLLGCIFEPFVQGPRGPERQQGGLGLGLTLVRSFVGLHGGRVEARSEGPGKGSTFSVELPAAAPARTEALRAPAGEPRRTPRRGLRVLVVDDNADAATLLGELLGLAGHDVRTAPDGPTALELATAFRPEVAVLDIGLPVMDGYELAQRLRDRLAADAPALIAVSGYGQPADRERSRAAGFVSHLVKPADVDRILDDLDRIAAQRQPLAAAANA